MKQVLAGVERIEVFLKNACRCWISEKIDGT